MPNSTPPRHLDYLEVNNVASNTHDFDSSGEGTNR